MQRLLSSAIAFMFVVALGAGPAAAKPCRDASGKFVKCQTKMTTPTKCRDAKGKFTKCNSK